MSVRNHRRKFGIALVCIVLVGLSLFSVLYSPDEKAPEPVQQSSVSPSSNSEPSVLSESVDTSSPDAALTYEQVLNEAGSRCEASGLSAGTSVYDACVEQETSQIAH